MQDFYPEDTIDDHSLKAKDSRHKQKHEKEKGSNRHKSKSSRSPKKDHRRSNSPRDKKHHKRHTSRESKSRKKSETPVKLERNLGQSLWDIPPMGFEHVSASQFKLLKTAGQIAPNQPLVPSGIAMANSGIATNNNVNKQSKKLYIGGVPNEVSEDVVVNFFNEKMTESNLITHPGNPVISCQINVEKGFSIMELRSVEETTNALELDNIEFMDQLLSVRRPKDYLPVVGVYDAPPNVPGDNPNKIYIGGLPTFLNDDQVKELLSTFGELKGLHIVKDTATGVSKGYGFFQYLDPAITDIAVTGLSGMVLGDKKLVVQRASVGARSTHISSNMATAHLQVPGFSFDEVVFTDATNVLCLMNMVMPDELKDDEEYEEIFEDIKSECSKFGVVLSMEIPRPSNRLNVPGVGKAFIEFQTKEQCQAAHDSLAGRKFCSRVVVTSYWSLEKYRYKEFS